MVSSVAWQWCPVVNPPVPVTASRWEKLQRAAPAPPLALVKAAVAKAALLEGAQKTWHPRLPTWLVVSLD